MNNIQSSILLKQVKIVNESLKLTMITTIVIGLVLWTQVYKEMNISFLASWLIVFFGSIIVRAFLLIEHKNAPPNKDNVK